MTAAGRSPGRAVAGTGSYVYGVVPPETPPDVVSAPGVAGADVRVVAEGALGALVSDVPLAEFDGAALEANLRDPVWLEAGARAHDAVLASALRAVPVVPFRFGTIFLDEDQLRAKLARDARLGDALELVRGHVELGVKGFLRRADAPAADQRPETDVPAGRRYLEQKQEARRAAEAEASAIAGAAEATHARLAEAADDARANPLQAPEVSGREEPMFLNGAYLVAVERERAFRSTLASLEAELEWPVAFELTGPWPAYNFVELDT